MRFTDVVDNQSSRLPPTTLSYSRPEIVHSPLFWMFLSYYNRETASSPMYDGRLAMRTRPPRRLMFLLFAAVFVIIILLSRHPFLAEPMGASLGLHSPFSSQNPASLAAAEPVVFALIMFSESSATEGAILLKVPYFL